MLECYLYEYESATVQSNMHGTWSRDPSWIINGTEMRRMFSNIGQQG